MTVLEDRQYEITRDDNDASILMGAGTFIRVMETQGLLGQPEVKDNDLELDGQHGADYAGEDFYTRRLVRMAVGLQYESSRSDVELLMDELHAVIRPGDVQMSMKRPGKVQRMVRGRIRNPEFDGNYLVTTGLAIGTFEMHCRDPRVYEDELHTETTQILSEVGGRVYPRVYPVVYGSTVVGGQIVVTNDGSMESPPILRIYGPVSNPEVRSVTEDRNMKFLISLSSADALEVDMLGHTIVLNGTVPSRGILDPTSKFWTVQPGENEYRYTAGVGSSSHIELDWRSAWPSA